MPCKPDLLIAVEELKKYLSNQAREYTIHYWEMFSLIEGKADVCFTVHIHSYSFSSYLKKDNILQFCVSSNHLKHFTVAQKPGLIFAKGTGISNCETTRTEMIASQDS